MLRKGIYVLLGLILSFRLATAQSAESLSAAKEQAETRRQPLLIAFISDDCDDCRAFVRASGESPDVQGALGAVAFYQVDAKSDEGRELVKKYDIGIRLPTFIFADATGSEITRWKNFLAPQPWLKKFSRAQSDVTTVEDRLARMDQTPTFADAMTLGSYCSEADRFADAARYYRVADRLNPDNKRDLKYDIFHALALSAWSGETDFTTVERAADDVLNSSYRTTINSARVASELTSLAIRLKKTDRLKKYLNFTIQGLSAGESPQYVRMRSRYEADYELYVNHDTAAAIKNAEVSAGPAFRRQPVDHYNFAIWCIERGIHLDEAARLLKKLYDAGEVPRGTEAGKQYDYSRLALARGDVDEAINLAREACRIDPVNPVYQEHLRDCEKQD